MLINFDEWEEYDGFSAGSGASEKIWLVNKATDQIGLFKYPKSEFTTEHISEKLASSIAKILDIPCAVVDIGTYYDRIGSMSYLINGKREIIKEGMDIIGKHYISYDRKKLYDRVKEEYYSLEIILESLYQYNLHNDFLKIVVFDYLIGNADRHQNNWALIERLGRFEICPIYDNGSSLCCYIQESKIDSYLGSDYQLFSSLVDTKSKSIIRLNKYEKYKPSHLQVLTYLIQEHYDEVINLLIKIDNDITEPKIKEILDFDCGELISNKRKELIIKFILKKVENIRKLLEGRA